MKSILERVSSMLNIIRAAFDIARSGGDVTAAVVALRERVQMQREELLAQRQAITTLLEEKRELAERLADQTELDGQRDMYRRVTLETGSVVYVGKEPRGGEDQKDVYLCAHCFKQRKESVLQIQDENFHHDTYQCDACGSTALIPNDRKMTCHTAPVSSDRKGF